MRTEDFGLILLNSKNGENKLLTVCLTSQNGIVSGIVRVPSKAQRHSLMVGNIIKLTHFYKKNTLGVIAYEPYKNYMTTLMYNRIKLFSVEVICELLYIFLRHERYIPYCNLYIQIINYLDLLHSNDMDNTAILAYFILLCLDILNESGYGLHLTKCIATGSTNIDHLVFVSPKSGAAVSYDAGKPYEKLMLILPQFCVINDITHASYDDIINGLKILLFFIPKTINSALEKQCPDKLLNGLNAIFKYYKSNEVAC